jgi:integrase
VALGVPARELRTRRPPSASECSPGTVWATETRSSVRDLPLGDVLLAALLEHRKRFKQCNPDELLFPSRSGTALCRNNLLRRVIYPACERAKIPRTGWHGLRHLHAALLSEAGEPLKVAQAQLGHADLQTTLAVYTHVMPESQRRALAKIESLIFPNFSQLRGTVQTERKRSSSKSNKA